MDIALAANRRSSSGKSDGSSRSVPNSGCRTARTVASGASDRMANARKATVYVFSAPLSSAATMVASESARAGVPVTSIGR